MFTHRKHHRNKDIRYRLLCHKIAKFLQEVSKLNLKVKQQNVAKTISQTNANEIFPPNVSDGIHKLNTAKQLLMDSERQKQEAEDKKKADAVKIAANDKETRQARERIIQQRQELIDVNNANREVAEFIGEAEVQQIYDNIDNAVDMEVTSVKRYAGVRRCQYAY